WFYAALGYKIGGPALAATYAARWMSFSGLYWLPIGLALNRMNRFRSLCAFAISLLGYCASLYVVYPIAGGHFAPSTLQMAGTYFVGHIVFFLLVAGLWWAARWRRWVSTTLLVVSVLLFLVGLAGPVSLITGADTYGWPRKPGRLNIVNATLIQLPEG